MASSESLNLVLFANDSSERSPFEHGEVENTIESRFAGLVHLARVAEEATFDALFLADTHTFGPEVAWPYHLTDDFEPFTLLSALSTVTSRLGLVATGTTSFEPPYTLARQTLSLDLLSEGRAGLNIVTSAGEETSVNFTLDPLPPHAERYRKAEESLHVIQHLWDGFEDTAVLPARDRGVITDVDRIHPTRFRGEHFAVDALLGQRRSPQGRPVVFQAGSSADGTAYAARHAEVVFSGIRELDQAVEFRHDLLRAAAEFGRTTLPKVLPGLFFVVGETTEHAQANLQRVLDRLVLERKIGGLKEIDIDLSGLPLDAPLPEFPTHSERHQTGLAGYRAMAQEGGPHTVRSFLQKAAFSGYFHSVVGSPERIADEIEAWQTAGAADGFVLFPGGGAHEQTELFAELVVPELRDRGLFRRAYEGRTLRDHLGLDRPRNLFT